MSGDLYIPERGDVIWLAFTPQSGREQAGTRPALVLSPKSYNDKASLAIVCPITNQQKGYPFEVSLSNTVPNITGVILADQVRSLDWRQRKASFICKAPVSIVDSVSAKIKVLLQIS